MDQHGSGNGKDVHVSMEKKYRRDYTNDVKKKRPNVILMMSDDQVKFLYLVFTHLHKVEGVGVLYEVIYVT